MRHRLGFTLIELMVSTAILILLIVILAQVVNYSSRAWIAGESSKERLQNARAIADFISNELDAALLPVNRTSTSNLQFVVNPTSIDSATFGHRDSIFWQAPYATDQAQGDVAEIGYFVKWDASNPANPRAILCRFFADAQDTANFKIYSNPASWLSDTVLDAVAPADRASAYKGMFAENVLGIWIVCLDPMGNPITRDAAGSALPAHTFDSRLGYSYTDTQTSTVVVKEPCALPAAIDLSLVLIDSPSARRIGPLERSAVQKLVDSSADAVTFVEVAGSDATLRQLRGSMQVCHTRIYLQNSK